MTRRIAINGFGRIGRMVFRILEDVADIEVVGINDLTDPATLAHLLEFDSVHGRFSKSIRVEDKAIIVDDRRVPTFAERNPADIPWGELGVELVLECTGVFRNKDTAAGHLSAGAKAVILSAPAKGPVDATIVMGVNDETLDMNTHRVVSNGSCTTNCLAPVVKVLDEAFGLNHGLVTTIHSYTNDQRLLDLPHSDLRRGRAAAVSMVPTSTGAAKAIGLVMPHLAGKLDGIAVRVPTPNVSLVDLVADVNTDVTADDVLNAVRAAVDGGLNGVLAIEDKPLVSTDYIGNPNSSIVDADNVMVIGGRTVKILSWYDNEWGFSCRMVDLARLMLQGI
ncbi:MAG: type I glyceraldehyde-3-phosphate dehydrogenase [Myxococcales bacterium]|nr:type I glyceraldehyde-3-phosphate dehydrogenase [Myxococcales bacterium]